MPESGGQVQPGRTYRVEFDGLIVAEFEARKHRSVIVEGIGNSTAFLIALPGNYDPSMRDTYTARPPAPPAAFRAESSSNWQPFDWPHLFENEPNGTYRVLIGDLGEIRISISDPEG